MILYVVFDTNLNNWRQMKEPLQIFNDIIIFLNAFLLSRPQNRIIIISNMKTIYDSKYTSLLTLLEILSDLKSAPSNLPQNIGYTMCLSQQQESSRILIVSLSLPNKSDYLKYIKLYFTSQKLNIRIDAVSFPKSFVFEYLASSNHGKYSSNLNNLLDFLFSLLGTKKPTENAYFQVTCVCHDKIILYGLVCPICLTIYCKFVPVCKKCKTKFTFQK
ncbi:putative transcription factor Tfb4 [Hamiltosporidium tvaerminnensis]|uniref:General transcription and DNA repair factor IIH subunit TFB4 n=1 Tax=Hamiltosporidium tvaerminnensis TaxID=1176355 RepID=A0A4Q9LZT5_9MICR|nr:putative transcription factor Tfb4 [Hamiltosporidium tvaerminnensis]TBU13451.1 putative transcription factor Tfb4 [Hamiltosporidium tvaerminnensis]